MGRYATVTDLITRFGETEIAQRVNRVNALDVIDAEGMVIAERALRDADDEIDGYLTTRYALPFAVVPTVLNRIACTIARYRLHDNGNDERIRKDYEDELKVLRGLSDGTISLGQQIASPSIPQTAHTVFAAPTVFSRPGHGGLR